MCRKIEIAAAMVLMLAIAGCKPRAQAYCAVKTGDGLCLANVIDANAIDSNITENAL